MKYAHIVGWGRYVPDRVLTNAEIARRVDTTEEWILSRTGIQERRIADAKESTTTMACQAAVKALEQAGVLPAQLDLIIVATVTSEYVFPATASQVQDYLGASKAGAFDLGAACSGFVYGLSMAAGMIISGMANNVLVIGAETLSRVVDWSDRGMCILFGDGAGAVVVQSSNVPGGVLGSVLGSDGSGCELLRLPTTAHARIMPAIGTPFSNNGHHPQPMYMNGREVFRFATQVTADAITQVLSQANLTLDDVALIIPHQANIRIIETAAKRLKLPMERFYTNIHKFGNTSTASIPLALYDAVAEGRLRSNDHVVFVGFGGGLSWGASVIKWDATLAPKEKKGGWRQNRWYALARTRSLWRRLNRKVEGKLTDDISL